MCQLFGISAQGLVYQGQGCLSPIAGNEMHNPIRFCLISQMPVVSDLSPEVVGVGANSVKAVVGCRNGHSQHLALAAAER